MEVFICLRMSPVDLAACAQTCTTWRDVIAGAPIGTFPTCGGGGGGGSLLTFDGVKALARLPGNASRFSAFDSPTGGQAMVRGLIDGLLRRARSQSHPSGRRHPDTVETFTMDVVFVDCPTVVRRAATTDGPHSLAWF